MAQFKRKNATLKQRARRKRKFVSKKKKQKVVLGKGSSKKKKSKDTTKVDKIDIQKKAKTREKTLPVESTDEAKAQLDSINRMIAEASEKLQRIEDQKREEHKDTSTIVDTPEAFDGIRGEEERWQLVENELIQERKRAKQLAHELSLVKEDFEEEKTKLEDKIRDLKRDMHRSKRISESSFFTLSKELQDAVEMMDEISATSETDDKQTEKKIEASPVSKKPEEINGDMGGENNENKKTEQQKEMKVVKKEREINKVENDIGKENKPKLKRSKKKMMITGGVAVVTLVLLSWLMQSRMGSHEVDEELVAEYLEKQGQVAGTSDKAGSSGEGEGSEISESETLPMQPTKFAEANADVSYEQSQWKALDEGIFGIHVEYPENAVNILKTDSNYTFLRRDGYIFKIQKIETGLDLNEYWKHIKATSLNYVIEETEFKEWKALKLSLEELIKYPGDRYLVKVDDNTIYDVWYATPSNDFEDDDIKRAKRMLESLTFID